MVSKLRFASVSAELSMPRRRGRVSCPVGRGRQDLFAVEVKPSFTGPEGNARAQAGAWVRGKRRQRPDRSQRRSAVSIENSCRPAGLRVWEFEGRF